MRGSFRTWKMKSELFDLVKATVDDLYSDEPMVALTKLDQLVTQLATSNNTKEFARIQSQFQCNVASALCHLLHSPSTNETMFLVHKNLQAVLLLHPQSRALFSRPINMRNLLAQVTESSSDLVIINAVQSLVFCMIRNVQNFRLFEALDGPKTLCAMYKSRQTSSDVKMKIIEFIFFYIIPETSGREEHDDGISRKTMEEKADYLSHYLTNIYDIVEEMKNSKPFGELDIEW